MCGRAIILAHAFAAVIAYGQELPRVEAGGFAPAIKAQIEDAERNARVHPRDAVAAGNLAMTLHAYGQYQLAVNAYQRARVLEPANFDWAYLLGAAQAASGDFDGAAASFEAALLLKTGDLAARLRLAQSLAAAAKWDRSIAEYRTILRDHPDCAQAWYGLGRAQAGAGDHTAAAESYSKACRVAPRYGPAQFALASELKRMGRKADAEEHLAAYGSDPTAEPPLDDPLFAHINALNRSPQAHLQRGAEWEKAGDLTQAIREQEAALAADPGTIQARINLISLYARVNQPQQATAQFQAAIRADPGRSDAWYNYGVFLIQQGKIDDAAKAFRTAIEISPLYAEARFNLGLIAEQSGNLEEAAREFEQSIAARPEYSPARFHLGRILVNQQRYEEGIRQLARSLDNAGEQRPRNLYALAAAYARAGDRTQALRYFAQARNAAAAGGQARLLEAIDRDLATLERKP